MLETQSANLTVIPSSPVQLHSRKRERKKNNDLLQPPGIFSFPVAALACNLASSRTHLYSIVRRLTHAHWIRIRALAVSLRRRTYIKVWNTLLVLKAEEERPLYTHQ